MEVKAKKVLIFVLTMLCTGIMIVLIPNHVKAATYKDDAYEPNDSFESATDYNSMGVLTGNAYNEGYRYNGAITSSTDEDYYYVNFTQGIIYFIDLKNLNENLNYRLELFDESHNRLLDSKNMHQEGLYQRYFYYKCPKSGKYYLRVSLYNDEPDGNYYFLYADEANRVVTNTRSTNCQIKLFGSFIQKQVFDGTSLNYYPKYAKIISMELGNEVSNGICDSIDKRITSATGRTYTAFGSNMSISGVSGQYISQKWNIEGKCSCRGSSSRTPLWHPSITVRYSFIAGPLPDNSIRSFDEVTIYD